MDALTFQEIIMRLDAYWAEKGCLVTQPYDVEVGAGTSAPATFLRVLGPEPWYVAYPQPSRRPDDGRYAENPNRYQHYFQYQVILKPPPADPLAIYLESLAALGLSDRDHDIRFVEDNWESPSLGAWGLGWEVWLDGLEITQYTYFQESGNIELLPPSVEITYGLERVAMYLQGVRDMADIHWNDRVTYGELYRQSEIDHCRYDFELADVATLRTVFDLYESEGARLIAADAVAPALDMVLKCSHAFNLLDARGAVGVTQRANYLARMRILARRVARAHLEQRERLGFPLQNAWPSPAPQRPANGQGQQQRASTSTDASERADLLVELGVEELPAADVTSALGQLRLSAPGVLAEAGLIHGDVEVVGTPRRLVMSVRDVGVGVGERVETVKGPPAAAAYDADGKPTRAAEGFARSAGVTLDQLLTEDIGGRPYVVARRQVVSRSALELLSESIPTLLGRIRFGRPMYWQSPDVTFSRPVRWLVALWGDQIVPTSFAGVEAGRATLPPRGQVQRAFDIPSAAAYQQMARDRDIVLDPRERQRLILERSRELAASVGGTLDEDPALVEEVANLVEWPNPLLAAFDPAYLDTPSAALVTVMKRHQRYLPIHDRDGGLMPHVVVVANGKREKPALIVRGNEEVLRARFADAQFFFRQDIRQPLAEHLPELAQLTFLEGLGSMLEKSERLTALAPEVARTLEIDADEELLQGAARLAKADLGTKLVRELTELQGEMGRVYALRGGESPEVANAIAEHYLPRSAGDRMPASEIGFVLGVSDRIDTLVAGFGAGLEPTGSSDPYGLRRAALGLLLMLVDRGRPASLNALIALAARRSPAPLADERANALRAFLRQRLRVWLVERGHRPEVVEAVLASSADRPSVTASTVAALEPALADDGFQRLMAGVKRADRIVPKGQDLELHAEALPESADRQLLEAYQSAERAVGGISPDDVDGLVKSMLPLTDPIDRFFTEVLVMAEDPSVREARLALLQRIRDLPSRSFDVSQIPAARP